MLAFNFGLDYMKYIIETYSFSNLTETCTLNQQYCSKLAAMKIQKKKI